MPVRKLTMQEEAVQIAIGPIELEADLLVPAEPRGIVVFAHGSGSSRLSPRNRHVAEALNENDFAALLLDLLTPEEESMDHITGVVRFDIGRLTSRLVKATDWIKGRSEIADLPIGYFGASTGAAAALAASVERPDVKAIVSRGGRPDLGWQVLDQVTAPVLFIVGGNDAQVLELNERAMGRIQSEKSLEVVPGASHLFEEPGALDEVVRLAQDWFARFL